MDTIMHIIYPGAKNNSGISGKQTGVRLVLNASKSHLHILNGVSRRIQMVHSASLAEVLSSSAKTIAEIVMTYEDKIYKRIPKGDI